MGIVATWCFIFIAVVPFFDLEAHGKSYSEKVDTQLAVLLYSISFSAVKTNDSLSFENTAVFYAGITVIAAGWFFSTNLKPVKTQVAANYICARCQQPIGRGLDYQLPCPRCGCTSYFTE
jgi:hypothetical protein